MILTGFFSKFLICTDDDLDFCFVLSSRNARPLILADLCEIRYGLTVAATLRCGLRTDAFVYKMIHLPPTMNQLKRLKTEKKVLIKLVSKIPKPHLLSVLRGFPARVRPSYKHTIVSCATAIVDLMRCMYLMQLSSDTFIHEFVSLLPECVVLPFLENREMQIMQILQHEFMTAVVSAIIATPYSQSRANKEQRVITRSISKRQIGLTRLGAT